MILALFYACVPSQPVGPSYHVPLLAEQSATADTSLDQVARTQALDGAAEYDAATLGLEMPASTEGGLAMEYDADELSAVDDGTSGGLPTDYENVFEGAKAVLVADTVGGLILGIPAAAVSVALQGTVTPYGDNVWVATNTVSDGRTSVTGTWVVAWVEVGWLAEMRLWSSDGQYNGEPWFNGFVSEDRTLGWWDVYAVDGTQTGVVEWLAPDADDAELGIASLSGDNAGDILGWLHSAEDDAVAYHDASIDDDAWVIAHADQSGEVRMADYAGGERACWGPDRMDIECPPEEPASDTGAP